MQDRIYNELQIELSKIELALVSEPIKDEDLLEFYHFKTILRYKIKSYANESVKLHLNIEPLITLLFNLRYATPFKKDLLKYIREEIINVLANFHENSKNNSPTLNQMNFKKSIIPVVLTQDLELFGLLHLGRLSSLYRGEWKGKSVAIKCVSTETLEDEKIYFKERNIMHNLTQLKAEFTLGLHGYFIEDKIGFLVMDFMRKGDLFEYMDQHKNTIFFGHYAIARKIAIGLRSLHQYNVIHCDLKPENILLDDNDNPKICDFGFSIMEKNIKLDVEYYCGTGGYIAPEIMKNQSYSRASDIYALGITFFVFFNNDSAYPVGMPLEEIEKSVLQDKRPEFNDICPTDVYKLIKWCWRESPQNRATDTEVIEELENVILAKL